MISPGLATFPLIVVIPEAIAYFYRPPRFVN